MKMKKILFFITIFVMGMAIMPNVHAASIDNLDSWISDKFKVTKHEGKVYEAKLIKDITQPENDAQGYDLTVASGETLTLDLAGHKFLSFSSIPIVVEEGATLTIKDSIGTGVIELSEVSKTTTPPDKDIPGCSTVINNGTLILDGGKILAGVKGHAALYNDGDLTINNGIIETQVEGAWGLTNVKNATIEGGTFIQGKDFSVIQNSGNMTIKGGDFKGSETGNSLITNNKGTESGPVTLNIIDGNFESDLIIYNEDGNDVTITGGHFQNQNNVAKYLADNLEFDEEGNIVEKQEPKEDATTDVKTEEPAEKNVDTSDINLGLLIIALITGVCGVAYTVKKKFN